jgi:hypothetical protein
MQNLSNEELLQKIAKTEKRIQKLKEENEEIERGTKMTNSNLKNADFDFVGYGDLNGVPCCVVNTSSSNANFDTKVNVASSENINNSLCVHMVKPKIGFVGADKKPLDSIMALGVSSFGMNSKIMPNITTVRVEESTSNKDKQTKTKIVFVDFTDGTSEKAILHPDDEFSLEQGISICITKKLLSMKTNGYGHSAYNKIINRGVAVYKRSVAAAEKAAKNQEAEEERITRLNAKIARKKAKRAAKKREYEIELRKEAYVRAMKEINGNGEDSAS